MIKGFSWPAKIMASPFKDRTDVCFSPLAWYVSFVNRHLGDVGEIGLISSAAILVSKVESHLDLELYYISSSWVD